MCTANHNKKDKNRINGSSIISLKRDIPSELNNTVDFTELKALAINKIIYYIR